MFYICVTIFEANHNKDYSVVKTFGKPLRHIVGGIFISKCFTNTYS